MTRVTLPARRRAETLKFKARGRSFLATVGYYDDGTIGEVFLVSGRTGSDSDIVSRDLGIAVSLALQHGCSIATFRHACLRVAGGLDGPLGKLLDILEDVQ